MSELATPGISSQYAELIDAARLARERAYAPYSGFAVGAALLTASGEVVAGCNVENASLGLTICAERNAVFAAVAAALLGDPAGETTIEAIAVVADSEDPVSPCGACRQVLHEFGPDCIVIAANLSGAVRAARLNELLPGAFGPWKRGPDCSP